MAKYEVQTVKLSSGREIAAAMLICPHCGRLDLHVDVDTSGKLWRARDSSGHEWEFSPEAQS